MEMENGQVQRVMEDSFMNRLKKNNPGEPEFHQAVYEVYESVLPVLEKHEEYRLNQVFERTVEPERIISFRVTWVDDNGKPQVNRGYRGANEQCNRPL